MLLLDDVILHSGLEEVRGQRSGVSGVSRVSTHPYTALYSVFNWWIKEKLMDLLKSFTITIIRCV